MTTYIQQVQSKQIDNANPWQGFAGGNWEKNIDVRDFIQRNYVPYSGDESFLADPTEDT